MTTGYWVICLQTYEVDGTEISRGRMKYHESVRPIVSNKWRRATQNEIDTKQWVKGIYYNHNID